MNPPRKNNKPSPSTIRRRQTTSSEARVRDDSRLAAIIAGRLAEEIIGGDLAEGKLIGTEADLMARFGVSRDPLREAIRILEWQGLVAASRGRSGGGLRVLAPGSTAVRNLLRTYLQLSDISLGELLEATGMLMEYLLETVTMRATRRQIAKMREAAAVAHTQFRSGAKEVQFNIDVFGEIVCGSPNIVARLLTQALSETSVDFMNIGRLPRFDTRAHLQVINRLGELIDAIERRDLDSVLRAHRDILRIGAESLSALQRRNSKIWNAHSFLMGNYNDALIHMSGRQKLAATIGYKIAAYIRRAELAPGVSISLESAGIEEGGTSRAVQREAMRLLEFFGVLQVRRGHEGGLYTTSPDPSHITAFACIYFGHMQVDRRHFVQLLEHLAQCAIQLCANNLSTAGLLEIRSHVDKFADTTDADEAFAIATEIGELIFTYSGNRALKLLGDVLLALARQAGYNGIAKVYRPVQIGRQCTDAAAQLTTAFLQSNPQGMMGALNALRRALTTLEPSS